MPSIFQEYKNYVKKYTAEYGDKTIVYLIVGSFFELYNVGNLIDMKKISELTDLTISRKDKSITEISEKNYEMAGFPEHSIGKYVKIMVKNGYNVVVVGPTSPPGTSPQTREVTDVFSPGTMIDNLESYETNNIMTLYFEEIRSHSNAHKKLLTIGIGIIDLSTGKNYAHEVSSTISDHHLSLDTCYRMITVYNPKEIIIFGKKMDDVTIEYLQDYLDCSKRYVHNKIDNFNLESLKLTYQTRILRRTFPNHGILSPIEYVSLERLPNALVAYVNLLQFAYDHNEKILDKITPPELIFEDDKLILSYNAIKQLDITGSSNNTLLRILNTATTAIGRRKFGEKFLNPIVDTDQLISRYRFIGTLADNKHCLKIAKLMETTYDIERQFRRMNLGRMHPMGFCNIDTTMKTIIKISEYLATHGICTELLGVDDTFVSTAEKFVEFYSSKLDLEEIRKYNLQNIHGSFFVKNNYPEIDAIQSNLDSATGWFDELLKMMNNINDNNFFRLDNNDRDGYYLLISKIRWEDLTKKFRNHSVRIENDYLQLPDFSSKPISAKSSNLRITHSKFENINKSISTNREKIRELMSKQYGDFIRECCEDWCEVFHGSIKLIGELDYYNTSARNAIKFKYSPPHIVLADKSYFSAKNLRHPIIERISDSEYITNDITLGQNLLDGMLLFGINSVGKSSLMKSIGLVIMMAQAGMWVPAAEFVFSPYHAIFTRIPSGDDIFRGQSTFTMEICELSNILKRANKNSLIIGDELCMGTETVSALAIVATCVIDLSKRGSTFICATHLHDLAEMKRIKELDNLTIQHLSMYYDDSQEIFVFDRKLKPGFGETLYGLEVCKGLHLEKHFLDLANDIRREIIGVSPEIVATKRSRYNSDHYVDHLCDVCSMKPKFTRIEVHHIKFQKDADTDGFHGEHHKDALYNLANICEECHDKVHNNKIKISGWITTSSGRKLDVKVSTQQVYTNHKKPVEANGLHTANHNISGTFKNIDTGTFDLLEIIAGLQQNNKNKREILQHLQDNYDRGITMYRLSKLLKT